MLRIERHESYRGRTTPEVTWRVWQNDKTYTEFKRKRDAVAYAQEAQTPEAYNFMLDPNGAR